MINMAHSEICPVCKGKGKLEDKPCHGCAGLGWITIQDNNSQWYPVYPSYPVYPGWPWSPPIDPYQPTWTCHTTCGEPIKEGLT